MRHRRLAGDAGSGLVSSLAGVTAFLAFLFLAVHLIVGLYATSVVQEAAAEAARRVAGSTSTDVPASAAEAEVALRHSLGALGNRASVTWSLGEDSVRVTVRVERPGFLRALGSDEIVRSASVRREVVR
ncbi:MAG TPA: hypothetical protein VMK16_16500 [Acidimicrobiales bacterium]|nr:hypothetical protein [Acidimicrobiales bacterium]